MLKGLKRYFSFFGMMASSINKEIASYYATIDSLQSIKEIINLSKIKVALTRTNLANQTKKGKI